MVLDNFPSVRMTLSKVNLVYGQICGKYGGNMGNVKPINTWPSAQILRLALKDSNAYKLGSLNSSK